MNGHGGDGGGFVPRNPDEALQYTPFTSVVPLRTDAIPLPMLQPLGNQHTFDVVHTLKERETAENRLKKLNAEAARSPDSPVVAEYLNELQGYLAPGEITTYQFKKPGASITRSTMGLSPADMSATVLPPQMGGFEELLFNRANVSFNYPSTRTSTLSVEQQKPYLPPPQTQQTSTPHPKPPPSTSPTKHLQTPQPQPMTPTHPRASPIKEPTSGRATAVMISTPKTFDKSAYIKDEALDKLLKISKPIGYSAESKSRKRKRTYSLMGEEDHVAPGVDKRAKADSLVQSLVNVLNAIFEADDNLQPDTSGATVHDGAGKYWLASSLDSGMPCLSTSIQTKLENSIRNVIEVGRFETIPVDDIFRAEKLCNNAVNRYELKDFKLPQNVEDIGHWVEQADELENGLKTVKTIMRIMIGGREEKQLYSEDILMSSLRFIKQLSEDLIVPLVELRSTGNTAELFKALIPHKKTLGGILHDLGYIFMMISRLITREQISEDAITSLEYTMLPVIFMEGATTEKDSIFGITRVERFRVCSMEVLEKIFAQYTSQHQFLFDSILSSLEKLHVNKKAQRQFKLDDGKNIMLVSALVVRLVQASSGYHPPKSERIMKSAEEEDEDEEAEEKPKKKTGLDGISGLEPSRNPGEVIQKLTSICHPLLQVAQRAAAYVVNFMIQRAMGATKTGESPYRSLMDLFVEDFITLLGRPDWPGTELMLNQIFLQSVRLIDDKSPSTAKQMSLEYLGLLGSGIVDLHKHAKDYRHRLEATDYDTTPTSESLISLAEKLQKNNVNDDAALYDWQGPCRAVVEYLLDSDSQDKNHQSATDYLLTVWGERLAGAYDKLSDTDENTMVDYAYTGAALCKLIVEHSTVDDQFSIETRIQADLASRIFVLNSDLCQRFDYLLNKLIRALENDQPTIRTRALKSITELITKDNALLEKKMLFPAILSRCSDNSSLVRDAALDLVGKVISLRPKLESDAFSVVVARCADTGVVVRKRAIRLLKEIYLRDNPDIEGCRVKISEAILGRNKDQDTSVVDLARKTLEEIWVAPCHPALRKDDADIANDTRVKESVNMMLHVANKREDSKELLIELIFAFISQTKDAKVGLQNFRVFKAMVVYLFAQLLEVEDSEKARRLQILTALTVFATASAKLFTNDQLIQLQPYTENLITVDDFSMYRSVVIIYRNVFPSVHSFQHSFLESTSVSLLKNLSKSPPKGVREAVECLWSINKVLNNPARIIAVTKSCIQRIVKIPANCTLDNVIMAATRVFNILGALGMICDFSPNLEEFKTLMKGVKGESVPELLAQVVLPYTSPNATPALRKAALECLGSICQTHGSLFLSESVLQSLDKVFAGEDKDLKNLVVEAFKGFLKLQESISANSLLTEEERNKKQDVPEGGRLAIQHNATQEDGVSTSLAQRYLNHIITIASSSLDSYAISATDVIGSILRQGLVHPKTCTAALVVLETSTLSHISAVAFSEHTKLNHKHEAIIERGYMEGVKKTFLYQRDVIKNNSGAIVSTQPYTPILHRLWDVLADGNKKYKQKFLGNLVMSMDFDAAGMKVDTLRTHLEYTRFAAENVAYFDYKETGDVYKVVATMESIASSTGVAIQHAIETEVMMIGKERIEGEVLKPDPEVLLIHALASACLSCMWSARSFLRKLYSVNEQKVRDFRRNKLAAKDLNRAPQKTPFQNSAPVVEECEKIVGGLGTGEEQLARCHELVEFLKVDNEFRLPNEDEEEFNVEKTPDDLESGDDEEGGIPALGASPNKRKRKAPADGPGAKKPRRKAPPKGKKGKAVGDLD